MTADDLIEAFQVARAGQTPELERLGGWPYFIEGTSRSLESEFGSLEGFSSDGFSVDTIRAEGSSLVIRGIMHLIGTQTGVSCRARFDLDLPESKVIDFEISWGSAWHDAPDRLRRPTGPFGYKKPNRWLVRATPLGIKLAPGH